MTAITFVDEFLLAAKEDGTIVYDGELDTNAPIIPGGPLALAGTGWDTALALTPDGTVVAWSPRLGGQTVPVPPTARSGVVAIAAGLSHFLALKGDGAVVAWGDNFDGQIAVPPAAQSGVKAVAAGDRFSMALKADGTVVYWGYDIGSTERVLAPVQGSVTAIAAGNYQALVLVATRTTALGTPDALDAKLRDQNGGQQSGGVGAVAVQPDGKILLGGNFFGGVYKNIVRIDADGTIDRDFSPSANIEVSTLAVQTDGKILLGGGFTLVNQSSRGGLARLNFDGTLDADFNPGTDGDVLCLAIQEDGKILIGGGFTSVHGVARNCLARLNPDGSLDAGFDPNLSGSLPEYGYSFVNSLQIQADGKILLGGVFTQLQPNGATGPTPRYCLARLNPDGTLDAAFDPNPNSAVYSVGLQADGKILIGGEFTSLQPNGAAKGITRYNLARLNPDGTADLGLKTDPKADSLVFEVDPDSNVSSVAVQADGKILLGGIFKLFPSQPNPRLYTAARLNADGSLDSGFDPNPDDYVRSISTQADGKVLLGGYFQGLFPNGATNATQRFLFARLQNDPATQSLTVPDATHVLWQRGGSSPELSQVTFELSTDDGSTWSPLGAGSRVGVAADWQLTHLFLPARGQIRARGRTSDGAGGSGLVGSVTDFNLATPSPAIARLSRVGNDLVFHGINGVAGTILHLGASADVNRDSGPWRAVATNVLAVSGDFTFTLPNAVRVEVPQQYYRLRTP